MKLAYFHDFDGVSGSTTNADRLCRAFHAHDDVDLVAVHAQGTGAPENFWTDELGYPALYPMSFRDGIEATDPDVVFVHGYNVDMIDYLSEHAPEDDRVYVFRNGVNTLEQWLMLPSHGQPRRVTTPVSALDCFDGIFAPSQAAAERIKFHYGDDAPHLAVAPCVIDYDHYAPEPFMSDGVCRVLTGSRIAANNYILAPLLAVRRLIQTADVKVDMEIMSAGPAPFTQTIQSVAGGLENVRIVGQIPADEVRGHLQKSDVVCVPSITQQAVPTFAVEAMAAGNVVLSGAYRTAYEEEALIRVPVDHIPSWYEALEDVLDDPDDAREYVRKGLDNAQAYDTDHVVREAYLPMLNLLLAEREVDADE